MLGKIEKRPRVNNKKTVSCSKYNKNAILSPLGTKSLPYSSQYFFLPRMSKKAGYPRYTPLNPLLSQQKFHPLCHVVMQNGRVQLALLNVLMRGVIPVTDNVGGDHFCTVDFYFHCLAGQFCVILFALFSRDKSSLCQWREKSCLGRVIGVELPRGNKPITSCCKQAIR